MAWVWWREGQGAKTEEGEVTMVNAFTLPQHSETSSIGPWIRYPRVKLSGLRQGTQISVIHNSDASNMQERKGNATKRIA